MSKNLPVKYYQENKERLPKKKFVKDIKNFLKTKKKKSGYIVVNATEISQKMKKNKLVEYRNKYYKTRKNTLS